MKPATLEFTLTPRLSTHTLEDVVVELYLGTSANALKFTVTRSGGHGRGRAAEEPSAPAASWMFDPKGQVGAQIPVLTRLLNMFLTTIGTKVGDPQGSAVEQLDTARVIFGIVSGLTMSHRTS